MAGVATPASLAFFLPQSDDSTDARWSRRRNKMSTNRVKPHLQSLILANQIFQDNVTNNFVIAGTFNQLTFRQNQPNEAASAAEASGQAQKKTIKALRSVGSPWLFFSVTDIVGKVSCSIRYVFLKDYQVLFSTDFTIASSDRLATLESRFALPPLPIVGAGQYALEFLAHDELIGSLRIMAVSEESETGASEND